MRSFGIILIGFGAGQLGMGAWHHYFPFIIIGAIIQIIGIALMQQKRN